MPQLALTEAVFYILLSLQKPLHGYGIIQNVEELSHGRVKLAAGTLYGALNSLVEKGWIDALPENPESRRLRPGDTVIITANNLFDGKVVNVTH